jgi:hypothetical protein
MRQGIVEKVRHILLFLLMACLMQNIYADEKFRLVVLADMGNEPDEMQQMVHLMMYNNKIDLEGLIAVTGIWLRPDFDGPAYRKRLHPDLFHQIIDGYAEVYENLKLHDEGWHTPQYLHNIVRTGQEQFGIDDVGEGKTSPGSRLITEVLLKEDPRPVYIVANAGANTLAQALWEYRNGHTEEETDEFISRMIVYENGAQDDAGAWILTHFPKIHWIRSTNQKNAYGGNTGVGSEHPNKLGPWVWKPHPYSVEGQHDWATEHIQTGHGRLGELYPDRFDNNKIHFIEGGGTVPWIGLITPGLYDPNHPHWGGFSGRYTAAKKAKVWSGYKSIAKREQAEFSTISAYADTSDTWTDPSDGKVYNNINTPVHRWRQVLFDDFKCRMDCCVGPFSNVNHPPSAVINGDHSESIYHIQASPGEELTLDASKSSDPDKGQKLFFNWSYYPEAGTWTGEFPPLKSGHSKQRFVVPEGANGHQIHLILDVYDNSKIASMHDIRRIVINNNSICTTN